MILILASLLVGPVDLVVRADYYLRESEWTSTPAGATYHYVLRNHAQEHLHNFTIGALPDTCPELQELLAAWSEQVMCPESIVAPKPWRGCVTFDEECAGYFLSFDHPAGHDGLAPGDSLAFSVTVAKADSAFARASLRIAGDRHSYEARARE